MGMTFRVRDLFASRAIWRLRREFEGTQYMPSDEVRAWQNERLARVVARAAVAVPYYRALFERPRLSPADIRAVEDLATLSTLTRETVSEEGRRLWSEGGRRRCGTVTTSGTSGRPITIAVDRNANAQERLEHILTHFLGPRMRVEVRRITRDRIKRTRDGKIPVLISGISLRQAVGDESSQMHSRV